MKEELYVLHCPCGMSYYLYGVSTQEEFQKLCEVLMEEVEKEAIIHNEGKHVYNFQCSEKLIEKLEERGFRKITPIMAILPENDAILEHNWEVWQKRRKSRNAALSPEIA
jgi:hypothetical protein